MSWAEFRSKKVRSLLSVREIPDHLITQRSGFIHMYGDSLKEALKASFPELNFDFKGGSCARILEVTFSLSRTQAKRILEQH